MDIPQQFNKQASTSNPASNASRRTKERSVAEAIAHVRMWRQLFEIGYVDKDGRKSKLSLQEAADQVGVPKKTLEDYYSIFKKLASLGLDLNQFINEKMGTLRNVIKRVKIEGNVSNVNQIQTKVEEDFFKTNQIKEEDLQQMQHQQWDDMVIEYQQESNVSEQVPDDIKIRKAISILTDNSCNYLCNNKLVQRGEQVKVLVEESKEAYKPLDHEE